MSAVLLLASAERNLYNGRQIQNKLFRIKHIIWSVKDNVNLYEVRKLLKKINDLLAGIPATVVAGLFLLLDLVPHLMEEFGNRTVSLDFLPFDPAWVTVLISGIPLLYLAVWRVIPNPGISKISSALLIVIAMFAAIAIGDLFAAGEVAWIMAIGAILEDMTTERAKKGLKKLISLAPA